MSISSKPTADRPAREAELQALSLGEIKSLYFKLTKKSSVFLVTKEALSNAILQHEYPNYKAPDKEKVGSNAKKDKVADTSAEVSPEDREKELSVLNVGELRKVHFRYTKASSLTLAKQSLINTIMEKEHPQYMTNKSKQKIAKKRSSSVKVTKKRKAAKANSPEEREALLVDLRIPLLRKLHFQLTKQSSIKLVSKSKIIIAILKAEYPDYKPQIVGRKLKSTSSSVRTSTTEGKSDTLPVKELPRTVKEREEQLKLINLLDLRKLYFKRTKTSSVFYVSKDSLIKAILQHEYQAYYKALKKKKMEKKKKSNQKGSRKSSEKVTVANISPGKKSKKSQKRSGSGTSNFVKGNRIRRYSLLKAFNKIDAQEEKELQEQYEHYKKISQDYAQSTGWECVGNYDKFEDIEDRVAAIVATIAQDLQKKPREGLHQEFHIATLPILSDDDPITIDWIKLMCQQFRQNRILQYENAWQILKRLYPVLRAEANVVEAETADGEDASFNIVGDLHGQLDDLLTILQLADFPSEQNRFLFNGDFVDRGQFSCEVVITVFALKVCSPDYVFLNRGNHEASNLNAMYGFEKEVIEKYDYDLYELFSNIFAFLPIATLINDAVFVVHGGLSWQDFTIEELQELDRFHRLVPEGLIKDLLWSDPEDIEGRQESARGAGLEFGEDVTETFKEINNVQLVIRSHEVVEDGYHIGHCITVFSASNYCGDTGNKGAYLHIDYPFKLRVATYMASNLVEQKEEYGRNVALEKSLIAKLLVRVANHRVSLEKYCDGIADENGEITKDEWSESLNQVLGIDVPFVRLAEQLGLGDFANDDVERIRYKDFLDNFRPMDPIRSDQEGTRSQLGELMFQKRVELMSLFRSFDPEKSGTISIDEFKKGISSLIKIGGHTIDTGEIDRLAGEIDLIAGLFFYDDYFSNYAPVDMAVMPNKREMVDMRKCKNIVLQEMALGVMKKNGLQEGTIGVKDSADVGGIKTLVAEEMEGREFQVLGEMRRKISVDKEEHDQRALVEAAAEATKYAEQLVAEETATDEEGVYSGEDDM